MEPQALDSRVPRKILETERGDVTGLERITQRGGSLYALNTKY